MSLDLKQQAENFGKGIGSMTRQNILEVLFDGSANVNKIVKITGFSQPLVSQHLKILKQCDLVKDTRLGQEIIYELNTATMRCFVNSLVDALDDYEAWLESENT